MFIRIKQKLFQCACLLMSILRTVLTFPYNWMLSFIEKLYKRKQNSLQLKETRTLGPLERYFYFWILQYDDTFPYKLTLSSTSPFTVKQISAAVSALVIQHPVLRKSFMNNGRTVELVEFPNKVDYLEVLSKNYFDSMFNEFSLNGKSWRLVLLEPDAEATHTITILIGVHHALSDYIYNRQIITSFILNLDKLQHGMTPSTDIVFKHSKPIEEMTSDTPIREVESYSVGPTYQNKKVLTATELLSHAVNKFGHAKSPFSSSRTIKWKLDKKTSQIFVDSRRKCKGSITALLLTVCISSFMKLTRTCLKKDEVVNLPFVFMVNLRRYIVNKEEFRGNASIDVQCYLQMASSFTSNKQFWVTANNVSIKIREIIESGHLLVAAKDWIDYPVAAIALTHVGSTDDFIEEKTNICLDDLETNTNVNQEMAPIFYVNTNSVRGEMQFFISYSSSLIPDLFAQKFADGISESIQNLENEHPN
ncbi:uncharacterized protein LOC127700365 [Mytilus californianus]|uniref:uncharacterized protein LOC127700365 n=1 Tax=Mytilus californianus TaxID=6549 RepID=UPI002247EBFF|nr:uncharacterized protein LOC127700365 [Mytilus californianus]